MDELEQHCVLRDESARDEAVLLGAYKLLDGFVHALCEEACEDLVVSVEEGDGPVVAWVIARPFLV